MEVLVPVALILVGLALVGVEVTLVPGFNVVGVLGALGAGLGVVMTFVTFGPAGGFVSLVGTLGASGLLFYAVRESGAWDRFILTDSLRRDADADRAELASRARRIGQAGTALTPLRPGGVAEIAGERVEVETEGAYVAAGSRLRVVAIDRRRTVVRPEDTPRPDAPRLDAAQPDGAQPDGA